MCVCVGFEPFKGLLVLGFLAVEQVSGPVLISKLVGGGQQMYFSVSLGWPLNVSPCATPTQSLQGLEEMRKGNWGVFEE